MQAAFRGVRVPGAFGAVAPEDAGEAIGVVGEVVERHRAVLDEGDRLSVALHRHHDVEPGLAHFPDGLLERGVERLDHRAGVAEVGHQLDEAAEPPLLGVRVLACELDEEEGVGLAPDEALDRRAEQRDVARELDHGAVDQLHRAGFQRDDVRGRLHRGPEAREVAHAEHPVGGERRERELDGGGAGERAFGADEEVAQVDGLVGRERIDVVPADPALELREALGDLRRVLPAEGEEVPGEHAERGVFGEQVGRHEAEAGARPVRQDGVDGAHVRPHGAVADRAGAATVVARHAADRRPAARGHVHREVKAVRAQEGVQAVEHHARLDRDAPLLRREGGDAVEVPGGVDDEAGADRLAALGGAGPAREHRHAGVAGDLDGAPDVGGVAGHDHAQGRDLVVRGVGAVAPAGEGVEVHLAFDFPFEPRRERGRTRRGFPTLPVRFGSHVIGPHESGSARRASRFLRDAAPRRPSAAVDERIDHFRIHAGMLP